MTQLVVQDINPRVQYVANQNQTTFTFDFLAFAQSDVAVYYVASGATPNDTTDKLTYNTQYTVTLNPQPSVGGTITLVTPANTGDIITIVRAQLYQRLNYYVDGGLFTATMVNSDFDQEVLMIQQNNMYNTAVTPHYNLSASPDPIIDIYLPVLGAGQCWVMNSNRTAIVATNFTGGGGGGGGGSGTVTSITFNSPLTGGTVTTTGAVGLATSGVTPGTYLNTTMTVDQYGRVISAANGPAGIATALTVTVTQTSHGFAVGNVIKCTGVDTYAKAQANTSANAEAIGIVTTVVDANNFIMTVGGFVTGLSGLTAGSSYFLSTATPGAYTTTIPTVTGQVIKPLFIAVDTTSAVWTNMLGMVI